MKEEITPETIHKTLFTEANISDVDMFELVSEYRSCEVFTYHARYELALYLCNGVNSWKYVSRVLLSSREFNDKQDVLKFHKVKDIDELLDRDTIEAVLECDNGHFVVIGY